MTAYDLLNTLQARGVTLEPVGDKLRYSPAEAVTPELREALRQHKAALLLALQLRTWLSEHGRLALEVPMPDGRQAVLITHDANRLLGFADGKLWWVAKTLSGQVLAIHGPAPADAVILPDPEPLPDAVVELLLRYEAGDFEPDIKACLSQIFTHNPDDALELLVQVARELGLTGALEVLAEPMGGQA